MTRKTRQFAKTASVLVALLVATPSFAERATFSSPSGNITCYLEGDDVFDAGERPLVCIMFEAAWTAPSDMGDEVCDLDEMHQVVMFPTGMPEAQMGCHGDVFWPLPEVTIGYGSMWSVMGYSCAMSQTGVSCENSGGHGFLLRRASVEIH